MLFLEGNVFADAFRYVTEQSRLILSYILTSNIHALSFAVNSIMPVLNDLSADNYTKGQLEP